MLIFSLFLLLLPAAAQHSKPDWAPLLEDNTTIADVPGRDDANPYSWWDSYSVNERCYCNSTLDHKIGDVLVETVLGTLTVRRVCNLLEEMGQPGAVGRPRYNDIQCGNGPANDAGDETTCPGRVEYGAEGCAYIGPTWKLDEFVDETNDNGGGGSSGPSAGAPRNQPTPPLTLLFTSQPSESPREKQQTDVPVVSPTETVLDPPSIMPSLMKITNTAAPFIIIPTADSPTVSTVTASQAPLPSLPEPPSRTNNTSLVPTILNATLSSRPTVLANNVTVTPSVVPSSAPTAFINETETMDVPSAVPSPAPTKSPALARVSSATSAGNPIYGFPFKILVVIVMLACLFCF